MKPPCELKSLFSTRTKSVANICTIQMHLSKPPALVAAVLFLLIHGLMFLPLFVGVLRFDFCFVLHYIASFLALK